jgi:phage terminase large subunit-like protein
MGHWSHWLCMGGVGQGKETKNVNVVNVLTVQEW